MQLDSIRLSKKNSFELTFKLNGWLETRFIKLLLHQHLFVFYTTNTWYILSCFASELVVFVSKLYNLMLFASRPYFWGSDPGLLVVPIWSLSAWCLVAQYSQQEVILGPCGKCHIADFNLRGLFSYYVFGIFIKCT